MIPKSGNRFPAFAKPASAGEGRSDAIIRNQGMRAALALIALLAPQMALAQSCPQPLASARRLVLVTADTLTSTTATVQRFARDAPNAPWKVSGGPATALIGYKGSA
jgi:hypothetical protein